LVLQFDKIKNDYRKYSKTESKDVFIKRCSHLGGIFLLIKIAHNFAGNLVIWRYSTTMSTYFGDWFGHISNFDISETIIQKYILKGIISKQSYRGRTNATKELLLNLMKIKPEIFDN
jgi:hypothetical protein